MNKHKEKVLSITGTTSTLVPWLPFFNKYSIDAKAILKPDSGLRATQLEDLSVTHRNNAVVVQSAGAASFAVSTWYAFDLSKQMLSQEIPVDLPTLVPFAVFGVLGIITYISGLKLAAKAKVYDQVSNLLVKRTDEFQTATVEFPK